MDSEQSSPANDVSCCGYIQSELLLVEILFYVFRRACSKYANAIRGIGPRRAVSMVWNDIER